MLAGSFGLSGKSHSRFKVLDRIWAYIHSFVVVMWDDVFNSKCANKYALFSPWLLYLWKGLTVQTQLTVIKKDGISRSLLFFACCAQAKSYRKSWATGIEWKNKMSVFGPPRSMSTGIFQCKACISYYEMPLALKICNNETYMSSTLAQQFSMWMSWVSGQSCPH